MKRIILMLAVCLTATIANAQVQYGGEIILRDNGGTRAPIHRQDDNMKVVDSTVYNKLGSGIAIDSATSRSTLKISQLPTVILDSSYTRNTMKVNVNGTVPVSLASVPSHAVTNAGTFAVQVDSSTQRSTVKISSMPSISIASDPRIDSLLATARGDSVTNDAFYNYFSAATTSQLSDILNNVEDYDEVIQQDSVAITSGSIFYPAYGTANYLDLRNVSPFGVDVYRSVFIQITKLSGTIAGTIIFYGSNDGVNFSIVPSWYYTNAVAVWTPDQLSSYTLYNTNAFRINTHFRYLKAYISGGSGSCYLRISAYFSKYDFVPTQVNTYGAGATTSQTQRVSIASEQIKSDIYVTGQSTTSVGNNIILATAGSGSYDAAGFNSATLHIITTGTVSSGTVIFEGSNDNSNWTTLSYMPLNNTTVNIANSLSITNGFNANELLWIPTRYVRARLSGAIVGGGTIQCYSLFRVGQYPVALSTYSTTAVGTTTSEFNQYQSEDVASGNGFSGNKIMGIRSDTLSTTTSANGDWSQINTDKTGTTIIKDQRQHRRTYSAAFAVTAASSCTDFVEIIGSSSKTLLIHKIVISGTQTTGGLQPLYIIKRSSVATGGTSSTATLVPHDATDAAATGSIKIYTANPTTGTGVGNVRVQTVPLPATTGETHETIIDFNQTGKPIYLSGTSQTLCLNWNGQTISGNALYVSIEWSETGE